MAGSDEKLGIPLSCKLAQTRLKYITPTWIY